MRLLRGVAAVFAVALAMVTFASTPASARGGALAGDPLPAAAGEQEYTVTVNQNGAYVASVCLKSDTTIKKNPRGSERKCSGDLDVAQSAILTVPYVPGDKIYLDTDIHWGKTYDNKDITGATNCTLSETVQAAKIDCPTPHVDFSYVEPSIAPYTLADAPHAMNLLNLLAWCVTAAGVAGLMIVGINMMLQLRRGDPGEFSEHWRGSIIVAIACILGMTAAPLVAFLHPY